MAYQKKYFSQFVSLDNKVNKVELWQDTRPETGGGEDLILQDAALFEAGSIDNFTGETKTGTAIRSVGFVPVPEVGVMTLATKTDTPFSIQFYNAAGEFISGVQHSIGFAALFATGHLSGKGQLKSTETLISI